MLANSFRRMVAAGKSIQLVFVSSDRDEAQFKEYFQEMPWLALP
ncbi:MAG: thioredoxin-like domain-containing protein, partial [Promethearchaeia archaeon]